MYRLKVGIKQDPIKRWGLPDRIFFGHGACHILAGTYLRETSINNFKAKWIRPKRDQAGNHIFISNGTISFDYHGYTPEQKLLDHHQKSWSTIYPDWEACVEIVNFDLLDTQALNERKMRGPDQYLHDPIRRAEIYLRKINHVKAIKKVSRLIELRGSKIG